MKAKRFLCLFLGILLSFGTLAGCQKKDAGDSGSQVKQSSEELEASANRQDGTPLTICVEENFAKYAEELAELLGINDGISHIELVVIPKDTNAQEAVLSGLRTEIMAGGGPDVFLLSCADPNWVEPRSVLFPYPEKTLHSRFFLPLDKMLPEGKYMNVEHLNPTILEAGKTDEGQVALPLLYTYSILAFPKTELEDSPYLQSWNELLQCEEPDVQKWVASTMFTNFFNLFGETIEPAEDRMILSEEDLTLYTKEAVRLAQKTDLLESAAEPVSGSCHMNEMLLQALSTGEEHIIFPFYNIDGKITANVTMFAAVNRNTEQPENAFRVLDLLFSDEIMSGKGFSLEIDGVEKFYGSSMNFAAVANGIRVNDVWRQTACKQMSERDKTALREAEDRIGTVRFLSTFDKELANVYAKCRFAETDEEIEKIVSKAYDTMLMILAES